MMKNYPDDEVMSFIKELSSSLGMSTSSVFKEFANFWVKTYATRRFSTYFSKYKTAKDFLKAMNTVHQFIVKVAKGATPPSFTYEEPDENTLIMTYHSKRGLTDLFYYLVLAICDKYNQRATVIKLAPNKLKIVFK